MRLIMDKKWQQKLKLKGNLKSKERMMYFTEFVEEYLIVQWYIERKNIDLDNIFIN